MTNLNLVAPVIAIDGPSASGKGTVAQLVAEQLGFHYLDSGALYRIVALAAKNQNIAWDNAALLTRLAQRLDIQFKAAEIYLNNQLVTADVRTEEIGRGASQVAVHATVRHALIDLQHSFRKTPGLVTDGRDMGTVIFPDATLKVFLTASAEIRAERRYKQITKQSTTDIACADYKKILADLQERDTRDKARTAAPLIEASDAVFLDTDQRTILEAVNFVLQAYQTAITSLYLSH